MGLEPAAVAAALDKANRARGMSGVLSVTIDDEAVFEAAYGFADRAHGIPNTIETRFAMASMSKAFTALAVMSLVDDRELSLDARVRDLLRDDLPLIDDDVTIEHLLSHTSGIGDYLDEEADWEVDDYVLPAAVHTLAETEAFLPLLDGYPQKTRPGEVFTYNNGGFMVLALVAERVSGVPYHDLVDQRVLSRAGLERTRFLRLDELPGDTAIGYVYDDPASLRTNVLHLPVRGNGDGGAFTTASDLSRFWRAFTDGRIVEAATRDDMIRPRNVDHGEDLRYGLGFYLDLDGPGLVLEGYDAGVSGWSRFDPESHVCVTVLSNSSEGVWGAVQTFADLST